MSDPLVKIARDGHVVTLTLNNPPVNALSSAVLEALIAALDTVESEGEARCVILTGTGEKAFSAGGDLRQERDFGGPEAAKAFRELGRRTLNRLEGYFVPVVSAILGYCIGGGTAIGWVCDIRIAADNAIFRAGDAYIGMVPSWGMGLTRLPRLVGRNRALDILLIGENFDAKTAQELGLITKVVPREKLMEEATAIARRISKASPNAIRATREAIAFNMREGWSAMAQFEEEICQQVFSHPDAHEGPKAFTEKREPVFARI